MYSNPMRVTRDVAAGEEHNYLNRDVKKGEIFYRFRGVTYNCVDTCNGIPLTERRETGPFFEFPADAVEDVER